MADCGCYPSRDGIVYCPKHAAADAMYEALRKAEKALDAMAPGWPSFGTFVEAHKATQAALALADGDTDA